MTDWEKHIGNKVYIQSAESSLAFYLLVLISNDTCKLAITIPTGCWVAEVVHSCTPSAGEEEGPGEEEGSELKDSQD